MSAYESGSASAPSSITSSASSARAFGMRLASTVAATITAKFAMPMKNEHRALVESEPSMLEHMAVLIEK